MNTSTTRREFLLQTGAVLGAPLLGCRGSTPSAGPAIIAASVRSVEHTLAGMAMRDGAGVKVINVIGQPGLPHLDPFVLLGWFRSDDPNDYFAGFPDHPHRGFETVSFMLDGHFRHHDSHGHQGDIGPGGAQWMTAGRGIVHSEMPLQDHGLMAGFQLWLNLPAKEKWRPHEYQDLEAPLLGHARFSSGGSTVTVVAGEMLGATGPARPRTTEPLLGNLWLEDDEPAELDVPHGHTAFVHVYRGAVEVGPVASPVVVPKDTLAVLGAGTRIRLRARDGRSGVLVGAARPIGEPIVQSGPFVMNTDEEIRQAWDDYRRGVLDKV